MHPSAKRLLVLLVASTAILTACGGGGSSNDGPSDGTPSAFTFADQTGVAPSTVITSAAVVVTGFDVPAAVTVAGAGGSYSVNGNAFTASAGTLNSGDSVRLRHTSSAADNAATNTTLTVGGVSDIFTSTTTGAAADSTPLPFSFTDQTAVAASTVITSAGVAITGINVPAAVSVTGGSYSVGCTATYVTAASTVVNGQNICVRHTSSATASTATNTTLTVGGVSDIFTSMTAGAAADTTPDAFSFTDQTGVASNTAITSAAVTISGIDAPTAVSVSGAGGTYSVNGAAFTAAAGTLTNGAMVQVRHTSAATAGTATATTLTVGGVSDSFTSTTAAAGPVVGLLPLLTGTGQLRLLDPTLATGGGNPTTVDTGLAPPPTDTGCNDCFEQARVFLSGTVTGTVVSNIHGARLAYAKRATGNDTGGMVFKINLVKGATSNLPVRISSLTDACELADADTTDFAAVDNSAVVVERAGPDHLCSTIADNTATVIRLSSLPADAGVDLPLVFDTNSPIHARTSATGAISGFVSFEGTAAAPRLVRRNANLGSPATLLMMADMTGASLEATDLARLFVTATPVDQGLQLFRVEPSGALSPTLYSFQEFNSGNPMQEGLHDATNLYFSDGNKMLRVPLGSTTENAAVVATVAASLRIVGSRALDTSTSPGRLVFEAQDDSLTVASGVFSAAVTANNAPVTTLVNYPDSLGGRAAVVMATQGRAYINIANHGEVPEDALRINTDGTGDTRTVGAYWAGSTRATSLDLGTDSDAPIQAILLARRVVSDGVGTDTLSMVNPATGVTGIVLGSVIGAADFEAIQVDGFGSRVLASVEVDRFGNLDRDVYILNTQAAGSLLPVSESDGSNDIPLRN